ncbi:hypothetical protein IFM89_017857 [Coptis chinensis]|uniref:PB1 domain-containing protein n=1 Tax=Coptis chinensis TaxID=261450 RepID=A0A835I468_9MAGN|nr:hypothetical protein IFM89_017857 [Coptis chinensis]
MEHTNSSGDSSPRSRDVDTEHPSWEEQPTNYKVKFMCSYGGKIQPKPNDNQLTYVGGDTKIFVIDRNIKFIDIFSKLASICDSTDILFKYQLPGEDLDALISVTNNEDLEHMMLEYDRIHRLSPKPPRLRLFLFKSFNNKPNHQWLADSVQSETQSNKDFLFGFDQRQQDPVVLQSQIPVEISGDSPAEIQRQIEELQRLQMANIANQEQAMFKKNSDEALARAFNADYYVHRNIPEKSVPVPVSTTPPPYMTGGYLIPSPAGMYQTSTAVQPVTGQVSQGYYAVPQGGYREQPVFTVGPPQPKIIARPGGAGETGYAQVAFDGAGRQVYYTAAPGSVMASSYQTVVGTGGVDLRQVGGGGALNINQEGKVATTAAV